MFSIVFIFKSADTEICVN